MNIHTKLYFEMLRIRSVEEYISKKYKEEKMRCPIHLSVGQEAIAVAICQNLKNSDKIVTAHRSHAHFLAKGGNLKSMISELHGKETGCAKGKGGSMHLIDKDAGIMAAVPIVGSSIPIGVGISWGLKLNKEKNILVIFLGDGATEEGVFQESLDFASLHNLPVLFVCENNHFSVYSHISKRQSRKRNILKIANAIGIDGCSINGNDVISIYSKTKKIIKKVRQNSKPYFVILDTFRFLEHCGPDNDDILNYRETKYLNEWKKKCPIKKIEKKLNLKKNHKLELKKIIQTEILKAFKFAEKSNYPNKSKLKTDIYA